MAATLVSSPFSALGHQLIRRVVVYLPGSVNLVGIRKPASLFCMSGKFFPRFVVRINGEPLVGSVCFVCCFVFFSCLFLCLFVVCSFVLFLVCSLRCSCLFGSSDVVPDPHLFLTPGSA